MCARTSDPAIVAAGDCAVTPHPAAADGSLGYFQHRFAVYGREGELCERCPGRAACPGVRRVVQSARSTFYCPRSQR